MRRFVLLTVVPLSIAFGAGIAVGSALTSKAPAQAGASSFSPEAIQRGIDARTLPETEVRDFN